MCRGVSSAAKRLWQRGKGRLQTRDRRRAEQGFLCGSLRHEARLQHHLRQMAMRLRDAKPRRIKPGEKGRARGRTQRLTVSVAKYHPACGQPVYVRRLVYVEP